MNPGASALHNFWHGNVETSTDTLVPVVESHPNGEPITISPSSFDDLPALPRHDDLLNGGSTALHHRNGELRPRVRPEIHSASGKLKSAFASNGNGLLAAEHVSHTEHQRAANGAPGIGTSNAFSVAAAAGNPASLYRRRRNSSNSRQTPLDVVSPGGVQSRCANGRFEHQCLLRVFFERGHY